MIVSLGNAFPFDYFGLVPVEVHHAWYYFSTGEAVYSLPIVVRYGPVQLQDTGYVLTLQ